MVRVLRRNFCEPFKQEPVTKRDQIGLVAEVAEPPRHVKGQVLCPSRKSVVRNNSNSPRTWRDLFTHQRFVPREWAMNVDE